MDSDEKSRKLSNTALRKGIEFREIILFEDAIRWFTKAIKFNPKNVYAYIYRGDLLDFCDQHDKALDDFNMAVNLGPNAYVYQKRGAHYNLIHEDIVEEDDKEYSIIVNKAIDDLDKAIELDPNSACAHYERSKAYKAALMADKAASDLAKAKKLSELMCVNA